MFLLPFCCSRGVAHEVFRCAEYFGMPSGTLNQHITAAVIRTGIPQTDF